MKNKNFLQFEITNNKNFGRSYNSEKTHQIHFYKMAQQSYIAQHAGLTLLLDETKKSEEWHAALELKVDNLQKSMDEQNQKMDDIQAALDKLVNQQEAVNNHDSAFKKITKALAPIFWPSVIKEG